MTLDGCVITFKAWAIEDRLDCRCGIHPYVGNGRGLMPDLFRNYGEAHLKCPRRSGLKPVRVTVTVKFPR